MKIIVFSLILFAQLFCYSWELEGFAGAQSTTYDEVDEANSYGVSARAKINFYKKNKGIYVNVASRGLSLFAGDLTVGYGWRTANAWFFEGGLGVSASSIYGTNLGLLAGTGYRISNNLFINFPMIVVGSGVYWSPYIGYSF